MLPSNTGNEPNNCCSHTPKPSSSTPKTRSQRNATIDNGRNQRRQRQQQWQQQQPRASRRNKSPPAEPMATVRERKQLPWASSPPLQYICRQRQRHHHKSSSPSNIIFRQHRLRHSGTATIQLITGCITGNNNFIAAAYTHHHPPLPLNITTNVSTTIYRSRYTSTNMSVPNFSGCKTSQGD